MFEIKVFDDVAELVESIAEQMLAFSMRGTPFHIALSGGSTPKALYKFIAGSTFKDDIEWSNLHLWWGDERMVPAGDGESNFGEAERLLFSKLQIPEQNLHPIRGDNDITNELQRLEQASIDLLPQMNGRASFDWILLGLGEDGHTASLFPEQVDYETEANWVEASHPESGQKRISLSAETLCNAQRVTYLVTGAGKAQIVDEIFADTEEADKYPAANIFSFEGETEWLLDAAAASNLTKGN